jgi:putative transposase
MLQVLIYSIIEMYIVCINSCIFAVMLRAYRYRILPTDDQKTLLDKHFGCVRFLYNLALETKSTAYAGNKISLSYNELSAQLTDLKKECEWLREVNSQCLQMALRNLDNSFQNFFKGRASFPNFKKKTNKQSFQLPQSVKVDFKNNCIDLPKFKLPIKAILHRKFKGEIKTVTISKTPTNKYFVSILVDNHKELPKPIKSNNAVGIDLGIKTFAVCSDGTEYANPKYLRNAMVKLKWMQRQLSKKVKGSNRRNVWKFRIAKQHERVANQRKDFLHKATTEITNRFDLVILEDLNIKGMVNNHKLAGAISDCGWNMFETMLKYKSEWKGKRVEYIGRFEPSSKICSTCGARNNELTLDVREWTCNNCNTTHDRDRNAANNILSFGLRNTSAERTLEYVEQPSLDGALKRKKRLSSVI